MTRRTARPTLRTVREDLPEGWGNPYPKQAIERGDLQAAMPLTSLDHPVLSKAVECFGEDPKQDSPVGPIHAAASERFHEVKISQWRGAVWIEPGGACWVVAVGLAKGNHQDRDDFYKRIERIEEGPGVASLLPTTEDADLWKLELAHSLLSDWHLGNQRAIAEALSSVASGGTTRLTIRAPEMAVEKGRHEILAEVDLIVERFEEPEYHAEEVVLTVREQADWRGSQLAAAFTMSLLACVHPPETDWEVAGGSYSNMLEIGTLSTRIAELLNMSESGTRTTPQMVTESHYVHSRDLTERTVEGRAARSLCGVYFVPRQEHDSLPKCPECEAAYAEAT